MRQKAFVVLAALCAACGLFAAASDFQMSIVPASTTIFGPASGTASGSVDMAVLLDSSVNGVQGWSFGVLTVPAAGVTLNITDVAKTPEILTVKAGAPADFSTTAHYLAGNLATKVGDCKPTCTGIASAAVTQGCVIDFDAVITMPAATDFPMLTLKVAVSGPVGTVAAEAGRMVFTDNLGSPQVGTLAVLDGNSYTPSAMDPAVITFEPRTCVGAAPFTVNVQDGSGFGQVTSNVTLNFNADGSVTLPVQGWSFGICVLDPAKIEIAAATSAGTDTATAKDGGKPDYDTIKISGDKAGVTHAIVIDFDAVVTIPADTDWSDLAVTYNLLTTTIGDTAMVVPCSAALGQPPVANVMVIDGNSIDASAYESPSQECCEGVVCNHLGVFTVVEDKKSFLPGNANGDKRVDIADGVFILSYVFRSGRVPPCMAAADFNNDGVIDLTDAIAVIYYQLQPELPGMPVDGWPGAALGPCGRYKVDLSCDIQQQCN